MTSTSGKQASSARTRIVVTYVVFILIIILMSNLNALVDHVLHPEIPYFDEEHVIVGGVIGLVSMVLFGLLALYIRYLNKALAKIKKLEAFLPICSNCKKVRIPGGDSKKNESWQDIESYITEYTTSQFSHGICPTCRETLYPELNHKAE